MNNKRVREIFLRVGRRRGLDRENIFPDIAEIILVQGRLSVDADRIFSKELIIGKVTPSWPREGVEGQQ